MTTETKVKTRIIDADGHYLEPAFALPDYMDPEFRDLAPRIIEKDDGNEYWVNNHWMKSNPTIGPGPQATESRATAVAGLAGVERWNHGVDLGNVMNLNYTQMNPAAQEPTARLGVMDDEFMDEAVLYPTMNLQTVNEPELHHAINRGLNNWLAEYYVQGGGGRLHGAVNIVAVHDVEWACEEARRCVNDFGFKAIFLRPCHAVEDARWWNDYYDPLFETAAELDVPIGFHPFPGDAMYGSGRLFDMIGPDIIQQFARTPVNHPVDSMHLITGIIAGGKLEKYPNLRFAILESSGGWLISLLERLDHRFEHLGHVVPHLKMTPTEYFRRQGWISFDPEEATLPLTAEWLGADQIIWGSDFPHPDAFYPNFVEMLNGKIAELSAEDQEKIRGLNAVDFYKL